MNPEAAYAHNHAPITPISFEKKLRGQAAADPSWQGVADNQVSAQPFWQCGFDRSRRPISRTITSQQAATAISLPAAMHKSAAFTLTEDSPSTVASVKISLRTALIWCFSGGPGRIIMAGACGCSCQPKA